MAEPPQPLQPVFQNEQSPSDVSPVSSRYGQTSPDSGFSPSAYFHNHGYQQPQVHTVQDMTGNTQQSNNPALPVSPSSPSSAVPPQLPPVGNVTPAIGGLGIAMQPGPSRSPVVRKPVGSTSPNTPGATRSMYGFMDDRSTLSSPTFDRSLPPQHSPEQQFPSMDASQYARGASGPSWAASPRPDDADAIIQASPDMGFSNQSATPINPGVIASPVSTVSPEKTAKDTTKQVSFTGDEEEFDDEIFYKGFTSPPSYCNSKEDIHTKRTSWLSMTVYILSVYSTIMSGLWLVVSFVQPRWGHGISSRIGMHPSTATTVAALLAKTIEMSFVTVFISLLGQVLTRRSFIRKTHGMTLAEMTMRNWVIQPGSLITHSENVPTAAMTVLGALTLTATVAATFYTTASDAMVAPKLKFGRWEHRELSGLVRTSYANASYVRTECPALNMGMDTEGGFSCMDVQSSGQSYRNLLNLMTTWIDLSDNDTVITEDWSTRPPGTTLLFDNTTMISSWIETHHSNVAQLYEEHDRIINNVTLAMPHPGIYGASNHEANGILQPDDLGGVGEYWVRAGVVSPSIGVMCVNMDADELAPLIYTEWPDAKTEETGVGDQLIGHEGWMDDVPEAVDEDGNSVYLNETDVDDIFRWGSDYDRRPPVFPMYPADYNIVSNTSVAWGDAIYMLGKKPEFDDYTLCELRSWVSPNCSTHFTISGTSGASMQAWCEDMDDENSYLRSFPSDTEWSMPPPDWIWMGHQWVMSMDLNGGTRNNNASNARILTQLALEEPFLSTDKPSMAEALAVYASSTLMTGSIDSPFVHFWDEEEGLEAPGKLQAFNATLCTQQYTSGHVSSWQAVFYVILILVFGINVFCLVYLLVRSGLVTDFTEPQNLFALAINSPPSKQLKGSCGGGPRKRDLVVPWRVAYAPSANHYFFEEANERPWKGRYAKDSIATGTDYDTVKGSSYKRLSVRKGWLL